MFAYLNKGGTVGHVIARRILREITGVPGFMLDCFFALFWAPDFTSYWAKDSESIEFSDGTKTTSIMRGVFGWVGEVAGYIIGAPLGAIIGLTLFVPDLIVRGFIFLHQKINDTLNDFAYFIGKTQLFYDLGAYANPQSYLQKSWNLGLAVIGITLGALPYTAAKALDFIFPFLELSSPVATLSTGIGGLLGWTLGLMIAVPAYFLQKFTDLLVLARSTVQDAVALVYACGHVPIESEEYDDCCVPGTIHSSEFTNKVHQYENSSWQKILFGPLRDETTENKTPKPTSTETHQNTYYPPVFESQAHPQNKPFYYPPSPENQTLFFN